MELLIFIVIAMRCDSSINKATGSGLDSHGSVPGRVIGHHVQNTCWVCPVVYWGLFCGRKTAKMWCWPLICI